MNQELAEIIQGISFSSIGLPLLIYILKIGLYGLSKIQKAENVTGILCFVSFASDSISLILFSHGMKTIGVINLYYLFQFVIINWFYFEVYFKDTNKMLLWSGIAVFCIAYLVQLIVYDNFMSHHTYISSLAGGISLVYGIAYSKHLLMSFPQTCNDIHLSSKLWINGAFLFYFSFSFWIFMVSHWFLKGIEKETAMLIWAFHNFNNIVKNIFLAAGMYAIAKEFDPAFFDDLRRNLASAKKIKG